MSDTVWDAEGSRFYETGVSHGILFPIGQTGVPWNGLVAVNIDPMGGEPESYYFDGLKYMDRVLAEDFQATIQAIQTPREFEPCEGVQPGGGYGLKTYFNKRDKFNLVWKTEIGSDAGERIGYKWHIAYNCLVQPSSRGYATIADTTTMDVRSFVITTTPACGRHSYYTFDSRDGDLSALEAQLLGGILPPCWALAGLGGPPSGGGPPPPPADDCPNFLVDYEPYNFGQRVSDDSTVGDNQKSIYGKINNGLEITELPAVGAFAANDSAASEVGTGVGINILADDDDATYITSADGDLGYTVGLPPLVGYVEGASLELHIRMSISGGVNPDDPDNLSATAQVHISTDATGDNTIGGFSDGANEGMGFALSNVDGTPVDYVVPLKMGAWVDSQLSDVIDALTAGAYLNVVGALNNNPASTVEVRVYNAKVVMFDNTDRTKFLRANGVGDNARSEIAIQEAGSPKVFSHTSYVDFKVRETMPQASTDGTTIDILSYADSGGPEPALFRVEENGGYARLVLYNHSGGTEITHIVLDKNTWYRAEIYFGWTNVRARAYNRDDSTTLLIDETYAHTLDPICLVTSRAGFFGNASV